MKIIEALKQIKALARKADDLHKKISEHCVDTEDMTPVYEDQRAKVAEWIQAHGDILKEIMRLRIAIQRTNLQTEATIDLGGVQVTKTLAEWLLRRGVGKNQAEGLCQKEKAVWAALADKGLRPKAMPNEKDSANPKIYMVRRYFDPAERDRKVDLYTSEPSLIDGTLEVKNAVTDLIEG